MPWTIPNLVLQNQPVPLGNMRRLGRNYVFVKCGNPDCYHNTELDVSRFPDDMTFNDLQPRMLCTVCDHRGADVGPSWLHPDVQLVPAVRRSHSPAPRSPTRHPR